jgi:hypothetical protein
MSTPYFFAVMFQFLHRCSIDMSTSLLHRLAFRGDNVLKKSPHILFLGQVTVCRCHPQASAQGGLNMKNEITQVIVIGVLLHCQACTSFHNLHGVVCYKALYTTPILPELTTNLKQLDALANQNSGTNANYMLLGGGVVITVLVIWMLYLLPSVADLVALRIGSFNTPFTSGQPMAPGLLVWAADMHQPKTQVQDSIGRGRLGI